MLSHCAFVRRKGENFAGFVEACCVLITYQRLLRGSRGCRQGPGGAARGPGNTWQRRLVRFLHDLARWRRVDVRVPARA